MQNVEIWVVSGVQGSLRAISDVIIRSSTYDFLLKLLDTTTCVYVSILYPLRDIASYLSKVADFHISQPYLAPRFGVTLVDFHQDIWHQ